MRRWWKWLVGALVVVPLVAYVTGSLASAQSEPTRHEPIVITVDPPTPTTSPTRQPTRAPTKAPTQQPTKAPTQAPSPEPTTVPDNDGPETVRPSPDDLDDDSDNEGRDDEPDEDGPDEDEPDDDESDDGSGSKDDD